MIQILLINFDNLKIRSCVYSLVVELGSALGLWLGLSALGVIELIISIFPSVNKLKPKKNKKKNIN